MTATEIASLLSARAESVCQYLLPNGVRRANEWCVGSPSGEAGNSCKVRVDGSKVGTWADFSQQGKSGDMIGLWMETKSVDLSTACDQALEWLGVSDSEDWGDPTPPKIIETKAPPKTWDKVQKKMRKGTPDELQAVSALRKLPSSAGAQLMSDAGQLFFVDYYDDDGFEYPAWIITDDSRKNAQARRMDGKPWTKKGKCSTIGGSSGSWPVGLHGINGHDIAFVEGSGDILAAWHCIAERGLQDRISPVAMLGASMIIPDEALPEFKGKRVFTFPHNDADGKGQASMTRWQSQMMKAYAFRIIPFDFSPSKVKDLNDLVSSGSPHLAQLFTYKKLGGPLRAPFDFGIPKDGDTSVLLGDRYLNRGDGAVLSSSSGMGKSSVSVQGALGWARGNSVFGIKPNGPLRSLIIQSEDTDGDIAEVVASVRHVEQLTDAEVATINSRVKIVTDRVNRGDNFIKALREHIEEHKPDLVWINPLQAFIDGDVTESKDLGKFLREGLNGLNEPSTFAYVIIHHTTKPATGNNKSERMWHEVMYDMAGGAEIINWARAILSLRATDTEGNFNLVLAKRGRRAGVVRTVGDQEEIVTQIPLKHARGRIPVDGVKRGSPIIYWESRDPDPEVEKAKKSGGGRPEVYPWKVYEDQIPAHNETPLPLVQLCSRCRVNKPIEPKQLYNVLEKYIEQGYVQLVHDNGKKYKKSAPRDYSTPAFKDE